MDVTVPVLPPDNTVVATINIGHSPFGAAVSPDGARLPAGRHGVRDRHRPCQCQPQPRIAVFPFGAGPYSAAVSPDGTRVYVANAVSDTVSVICVVPA